MNFFGHAALAFRGNRDPEFVTGAMLPDLVQMAQLPFGGVSSPALQAGIEHHLAIDRLFHAGTTFRAMTSESAARLRTVGVSKGSSIAAAHVGIELLLDGELATDAECCRAYRCALELAAAGLANCINWTSPDGPDRWRHLFLRLTNSAIPDGYRDLGFVRDRIAGALSRRPRLKLLDTEHRPLLDELARLRDAVTRSVQQLLVGA